MIREKEERERRIKEIEEMRKRVRREDDDKTLWLDTLISDENGEFGAQENVGFGRINYTKQHNLREEVEGCAKAKWEHFCSLPYILHILHLHFSGPPERWLWASCLHEDCRDCCHRWSLAWRLLFAKWNQTEGVNMISSDICVFLFTCCLVNQSTTYPYIIIYQRIYSVSLSTLTFANEWKYILIVNVKILLLCNVEWGFLDQLTIKTHGN